MAKSKEEINQDSILYQTIMLLKQELGRLPTEAEVYNFVFGTPEDQKKILSGSQD